MIDRFIDWCDEHAGLVTAILIAICAFALFMHPAGWPYLVGGAAFGLIMGMVTR